MGEEISHGTALTEDPAAEVVSGGATEVGGSGDSGQRDGTPVAFDGHTEGSIISQVKRIDVVRSLTEENVGVLTESLDAGLIEESDLAQYDFQIGTVDGHLIMAGLNVLGFFSEALQPQIKKLIYSLEAANEAAADLLGPEKEDKISRAEMVLEARAFGEMVGMSNKETDRMVDEVIAKYDGMAPGEADLHDGPSSEDSDPALD